MFTRLLRFAPFAAALAVAAVSVPAQAGGVSWSVGINAPIAPGVHVGTVIGGGGHHHHRHYVPAPVVYAPPPVYVAPPVYAPVVYAPRPVYVAPRPVVYRAPVVVRPGHRHHHHHHHRGDNRGDINWPQGQPSRGGYGPVAMAR